MATGSVRLVITGIVLAALVLAAGIGPRRGRLSGSVLAVVAVVWLLVNDPMEGAVLLPVTDSHGLTAADLAGLSALVLAGWRATRPRRVRATLANEQPADSPPG